MPQVKRVFSTENLRESKNGSWSHGPDGSCCPCNEGTCETKEPRIVQNAQERRRLAHRPFPSRGRRRQRSHGDASGHRSRGGTGCCSETPGRGRVCDHHTPSVGFLRGRCPSYVRIFQNSSNELLILIISDARAAVETRAETRRALRPVPTDGTTSQPRRGRWCSQDTGHSITARTPPVALSAPPPLPSAPRNPGNRSSILRF